MIDPPEVAVICNLGLDHTEVLGNTLEEIAKAKAGIIKPGCTAVLYRGTPSVEAVFEETCNAQGVELRKADFDALTARSHSFAGQVFDFGPRLSLQIPLLGAHQLRNAAVALTAVDCLIRRGWEISEEQIRDGLRDVVWPGRFELLRKHPDVIVDGGHNPQCLEALAQNVRDYLDGREITALTGVMADKDYTHMYKTMAPLVTRFVTVTPDNPRAMAADALKGDFDPLRQTCYSLHHGAPGRGGGPPAGWPPGAGVGLWQPVYGGRRAQDSAGRVSVLIARSAMLAFCKALCYDKKDPCSRWTVQNIPSCCMTTKNSHGSAFLASRGCKGE